MQQDAAGYKIFTTEGLQEILHKHQLWLDGKEGGVRANLYSANLESANLYSANLVRANLESAKYGDETLRGFLQIGPIGSRKSMLQVFGIGAAGFVFRAGCFTGSLEEFTAIVEKKHGDNEHGVKYRCAIEFAKQMLPPKKGN